ncbi:unnamed protein product [Ceutorhynchus assimilis]|uniref:Amine oxidase domain-containing protein n=1 Tax=Ceutorhynchus assimilis TaxID=467358 RepID=A0A9N9MMT1_9CUCU|nr:unnamed protein product [Ceutorhynchus assimilis]
MWFKKIIAIIFLIYGTIGLVLPSDPSIIIVGSGPAGIAAATKLLKNNFTKIKILEAENRIGGRINSIKFGDAYVDLGAQFCHGQEGNIVYSMVKDFDILRPSTHKFQMIRSNGEKVDEETANKIMNFAELLLEASEEDPLPECENAKSVGECLDIRSKVLEDSSKNDKQKEIFSEAHPWAKSYISALDGTLDLYDLDYNTTYKTCGGDLGMNWNGHGYKTILEIMMQKYPNPDHQLPIDNKIFLEQTVANISNWQNDNRVTVTTTDGTKYEADHVIFTPSVGVLKANHEELFTPALPADKISAIKNTGFGAILKVIVHFNQRWYENNPTWAFFWTAKDVDELEEKNLEWLLDMEGVVQAENNPNVLVFWYSGSHVPLIETLSEATIKEAHEYLINKFLAPHYNVTMPDKYIRTTWFSNPNFRGTYSYESVKGHSGGQYNLQEKLGSPLMNEDGKLTLLFAGEATHPHYFSTVHGAIESGYREADRLIEVYTK